MKHLQFSAAVGLATMTCLGAADRAAAQTSNTEIYSDSSFTIAGGVGYTWLKSNEIVYDEDGDRLSQLIWKASAPLLSLEASGKFGDAWTLSGTVQVGFSGNSHMADYDWLDFSPSLADSDWDSRSLHPDTKLDRYINLSIAAGRDFALGPTTLNLHGGFKYTNMKLTSYGGSYTYSADGFRDDIGNFADGERGITFEQRLPALFLGTSAKTQLDRLTLGGMLRGGFTIGATDTDHHWLRDLRFKEKYRTMPFLSFGAEVGYQYSGRANIFLAANYEQFFRRKGDTTIYSIATGEQVSPINPNGAGMDFRSITLRSGVKYSF